MAKSQIKPQCVTFQKATIRKLCLGAMVHNECSCQFASQLGLQYAWTRFRRILQASPIISASEPVQIIVPIMHLRSFLLDSGHTTNPIWHSVLQSYQRRRSNPLRWAKTNFRWFGYAAITDWGTGQTTYKACQAGNRLWYLIDWSTVLLLSKVYRSRAM